MKKKDKRIGIFVGKPIKRIREDFKYSSKMPDKIKNVDIDKEWPGIVSLIKEHLFKCQKPK